MAYQWRSLTETLWLWGGGWRWWRPRRPPPGCHVVGALTRWRIRRIAYEGRFAGLLDNPPLKGGDGPFRFSARSLGKTAAGEFPQLEKRPCNGDGPRRDGRVAARQAVARQLDGDRWSASTRTGGVPFGDDGDGLVILAPTSGGFAPWWRWRSWNGSTRPARPGRNASQD